MNGIPSYGPGSVWNTNCDCCQNGCGQPTHWVTTECDPVRVHNDCTLSGGGECFNWCCPNSCQCVSIPITWQNDGEQIQRFCDTYTGVDIVKCCVIMDLPPMKPILMSCGKMIHDDCVEMGNTPGWAEVGLRIETKGRDCDCGCDGGDDPYHRCCCTGEAHTIGSCCETFCQDMGEFPECPNDLICTKTCHENMTFEACQEFTRGHEPGDEETISWGTWAGPDAGPCAEWCQPGIYCGTKRPLFDDKSLRRIPRKIQQTLRTKEDAILNVAKRRKKKSSQKAWEKYLTDKKKKGGS